MCEFLGMSVNMLIDLCFSFIGFMCCGGEIGLYKDGWGVVFYEGKGVCLFYDFEFCVILKIVEFVSKFLIKSKIVVCYICQVNVGNINLLNMYLFIWEFWG